MVLSVIRLIMFQFLEILNLEGNLNHITGLRITAILLDFAYWWSFIDGGSAINKATPSSLFSYPVLEVFVEQSLAWPGSANNF